MYMRMFYKVTMAKNVCEIANADTQKIMVD